MKNVYGLVGIRRVNNIIIINYRIKTLTLQYLTFLLKIIWPSFKFNDIYQSIFLRRLHNIYSTFLSELSINSFLFGPFSIHHCLLTVLNTKWIISEAIIILERNHYPARDDIPNTNRYRVRKTFATSITHETVIQRQSKLTLTISYNNDGETIFLLFPFTMLSCCLVAHCFCFRQKFLMNIEVYAKSPIC